MNVLIHSEISQIDSDEILFAGGPVEQSYSVRMPPIWGFKLTVWDPDDPENVRVLDFTDSGRSATRVGTLTIRPATKAEVRQGELMLTIDPGAGSADVVQISNDYPLLWQRSVTADTRDRLGQSVDPLDAECDAVMREIWMARSQLERERELWSAQSRVISALATEVPDDVRARAFALLRTGHSDPGDETER